MTLATNYLSKWSETSDTYRTMRGALNAVARVLDPATDHATYPWGSLRREDVRQIPAKLRKAGLAVNTVNKCLSALRGLLAEAAESGELPVEEYRRIGRIRGLPGAAQAAGRALDEAEGEILAEKAEVVSLRDAALIAVLFACGLRRIEAVRLRKEDYNPEAGEILARGKGDKERTVPVPEEWRPAIEAHWRDVPARGMLFTSRRRRSLSRSGVSQIVERFCRDTGVQRFTPHDLRRTFATWVIEKSDPLVAQRLLGHASSDTTGIYDRRGRAAGARAVNEAFRRRKK